MTDQPSPLEDQAAAPGQEAKPEKAHLRIVLAVVLLIVCIALLWNVWQRASVVIEEHRIMSEHVEQRQFDVAYEAFVALAARTRGNTRVHLEEQAAVSAANHAQSIMDIRESAAWYYKAWELDDDLLDEQGMKFVHIHKTSLENGLIDQTPEIVVD